MSSFLNFVGLCFGAGLAGLILGALVEVNAMEMQILPDSDGEGYVLNMHGPVDEGDTAKLKAIIKAGNIEKIYLTSNGGYVHEGLGMANLIRDMNVPTIVYSHCHSACTFMFAAGSKSVIMAYGIVGLHNPYYYFLGMTWDIGVNTPLYWNLYDSFTNYFRGDERMAHIWVAQTFDTDSEDLFIIDASNAKFYGVEYLPLFAK